MVLIEEDEKADNADKTFRSHLVERLYRLLWTNVFFSIALAFLGFIAMNAYPPSNGVSCRHILPFLLHVLFIKFVHKLQYSLYRKHYRLRHFEETGIDLDKQEEERRQRMHFEREKRKISIPGLGTTKATGKFAALAQKIPGAEARGKLSKLFARSAHMVSQQTRYFLHFLWIYEVIAILILAFATWSHCGVFGRSVVRNEGEDEDIYAGIFGTDRGRFDSQSSQFPPIGNPYDPEKELTCCECPGVYCPYVYGRESLAINPNCPCYESEIQKRYDAEKLRLQQEREISLAAKNGTILYFREDGSRVFVQNETFRLEALAHQAALAAASASTTAAPFNPVDFPAQCSLRYMRRSCVGMICFYGSEDEYNSRVPPECRSGVANPDQWPSASTVTTDFYVPPVTIDTSSVTAEPKYEPPDYTGCLFGPWGGWGACSAKCCCNGLEFRVRKADPSVPSGTFCAAAQENEMRPCNRDVPCVATIERVSLDLSCEDNRMEYQCESGYACLRRLRIGHTVMLDVYSDEKGFLLPNQRATVVGFRLRMTEPGNFCLRFVDIERNGVKWTYLEESLVHVTPHFGESCPVEFMFPNQIIGPQTEPDCPLSREPYVNFAVAAYTATTTVNPEIKYLGLEVQVYDPLTKRYRPKSEVDAERAEMLKEDETEKVGFALLDDCYPYLFVPYVAGLLETAVKAPCPDQESSGPVFKLILGLVAILQVVIRAYFLYVERLQKLEMESAKVVPRKTVIHADIRDGQEILHSGHKSIAMMTTEEKMVALGYGEQGKLFSQLTDEGFSGHLQVLSSSSEEFHEDGHKERLGRVLNESGKRYMEEEDLPEEFQNLRSQHERFAKKRHEERMRRREYLASMSEADRERLDRMLEDRLHNNLKASFTQVDRRRKSQGTARMQPALERDLATGTFKMVLVDTAPTPPPEEEFPIYRPGEDYLPPAFREWEDEKDFPGSTSTFSPTKSFLALTDAGGKRRKVYPEAIEDAFPEDRPTARSSRSGRSGGGLASRAIGDGLLPVLTDADLEKSIGSRKSGARSQDNLDQSRSQSQKSSRKGGPPGSTSGAEQQDPLELSIVPPIKEFATPKSMIQPLSPGQQVSETPAGGELSRPAQYLMSQVEKDVAGDFDSAMMVYEGPPGSQLPSTGPVLPRPPKGRPPDLKPKEAPGIRLAPVSHMLDRQRETKEAQESMAQSSLDASFADGVPRTPHSSVASGVMHAGRQILMTDNLGNALLTARVDNPRQSDKVCVSCNTAIRTKKGTRVQVCISPVNDYTLCAPCAKQVESLMSCWLGRITEEDQLTAAKMLAKIQGKQYKVEKELYVIQGASVIFNGKEIFKLKAKISVEKTKAKKPRDLLFTKEQQETADTQVGTENAAENWQTLKVFRPIIGIVAPEGDLICIDEVKVDGSIVWSDGDEWVVFDEEEQQKEREEREKLRLQRLEEARLQAEYEEFLRQQEIARIEKEKKEEEERQRQLEQERLEMEKQLMRDKGFDPDDMDEEELEMARKIIYGKGGDDDDDD
ncbi:unnamed protein product [Amoebophrya sp. A120]|nr:unnamed protein product [Amoebophrya sp. A120]|eukprot:GSA120T00012127001.1